MTLRSLTRLRISWSLVEIKHNWICTWRSLFLTVKQTEICKYLPIGRKIEKYPELSFMARDVLSIPITTVASESTFSIGGRIIGKFQSSILPANAESKLCTRDWLCGQEDCDGSHTDEDEIVVDLQPYLARLGSH